MTAQTSRELVIERIFNAPRDVVYRAFTDPDQLSAWFGPAGWSVPRESVEIDPRPGGVEKFVMVNDEDPEQTSPVNARFTEVIENELLVGEEGPGSGDPADPGSKLTARLEFHDEPGGRTRLVLRQGPFPEDVTEMAREGWGSSFTKLDTLLSR